MVKFEGYPTGEAKRSYAKNARKFGHKTILVSWLLLLPAFISVSYSMRRWIFVGIYLLVAGMLHLTVCLFRGKSISLSKSIYTEDEYIIALGDDFQQIKSISDVKYVIDHGDFYELVFPLGNVTDKFICQKDLLVEGTLEEFEALFKDKLRKAGK